MQSLKPSGRDRPTAHVVYDKVTGRILGRFRRYDAIEDRVQHVDAEEVLAVFRRDQTVLAHVTAGDPENLAVAAAAVEEAEGVRRLRVAPGGVVEALPRIRLFSNRDALEGNGEDSVELTVDIVDERDAVVRDFDGEIKVTTTHGKLSARGGLVRAIKGRASLTLTSTRETIDEVRVRAGTLEGAAQAAEITLSFE